MALASYEYSNATGVITALNERIADDDYPGTTEDTVRSELVKWTNYRKLLRGYINSGDGRKALPTL